MLCIRGMEGLGDNLHHRAIIRQLLARGETILLETSWPSIYHDLVGERLRLVFPQLRHRTQSINAQRERHLYQVQAFPAGVPIVKMDFRPKYSKTFASVLGEMFRSFASFRLDTDAADFRLPVPQTWAPELRRRFAEIDRPIMFYRPLVDRINWKISKARNPDLAAYAQLYRAIRERFYVVSVADLKPGEEWIVGEEAEVDCKFHAGELGVQELCALTDMAALMFAAPGFAIPLAQAISTPTVAVFGNFENSTSFSIGARFAPYCPIDTLERCRHFTATCGCSKRINLTEATARVLRFVDEHVQHSRQAQAA